MLSECGHFLLKASIVCTCLFSENVNTFGQNERPVCRTVEYNIWLKSQFPDNVPSDDVFEGWISQKIAEQQSSNKRSAGVIRTIPVIFHIFHNPGQGVGVGSNITASQVQSQIDVLNEDFRRTGSGYNSHPSGADAEIEFCLALEDEDGNVLPEPGILRWSNFGAGPFSRPHVDNYIKPPTSQDPSRFLNYWVVALPQYNIGYAQFPISSGLPDLSAITGLSQTDGIVVIPTATGTTGTATAPYNLGRTATHEIGHWLGLRHLWGDGNCQADDYCSDTPPCSYAYYADLPSCNKPNQCGSLRMIENYMDYSADGCMNIFTQGQKARMNAVLANSPNRPYSVGTAPTVCHPFVLANIKHHPETIRSCGATTIQFNNLAEVTPDSVLWTFSGINASPSNTMQTSPTVMVSSTGTLSINLEAHYSTISEMKSSEMSVIILPNHDPSCLAPTCSDGIRNGNETGIDCGGSCPENCSVNCDQVIVYNGPFLLSGNIQAGKFIEAGNLTGAGEVAIYPGQEVWLKAQDSILLQKGFKIESGAVFEIQLQGCN